MNPEGDSPASCRNCGNPAGPRYCGHCGQEVVERRGSFGSIARDLFAEWFSVDGALAATVRAIARPGRLTTEHLAGRRARYLRPLRLYAVASLALFSTALALRTPDVSGVDLYIGEELVAESAPGNVRSSITLFSDEYVTRWFMVHSPDAVERVRAMPPQEVVDMTFDGLRRWLSTAMIASLPLLALVLKLLYLRRRVPYVEHLVFAIHFQSALFLALVAAWAIVFVARLDTLGSAVAYAVAGFAILLLYMPVALRRVYGRGRERLPWTLLKAALVVYGYLQVVKLSVGLAMAGVLLRV